MSSVDPRLFLEPIDSLLRSPLIVLNVINVSLAFVRIQIPIMIILLTGCLAEKRFVSGMYQIDPSKILTQSRCSGGLPEPVGDCQSNARTLFFRLSLIFSTMTIAARLPVLIVNRLIMNLRQYTASTTIGSASSPSAIHTTLPEPVFAQNAILGNMGAPLDHLSEQEQEEYDDNRFFKDEEAHVEMPRRRLPVVEEEI